MFCIDRRGRRGHHGRVADRVADRPLGSQYQRWGDLVSLPPYVQKNLDYFLDHEPEDPDRYGPLILALCERWGI